MNKTLLEVYTRQLEQIDSHLKNYNAEVQKDKRATNPFFISAPDNYASYKNSIMIFGQETNCWCSECGKGSEYSNSLTKSLAVYDTFYHKGGIKKYRGPFWNEFKRIRKEVTKHKDATFIWNNINKIGRIGKGNIPAINNIQFEHFNVIRDEIQILNPRIMVFLTGPDYDHFIRRNIGKFIQREIDDCLYELTFENNFGNIKAFKTFHPNSLYFQGKNKTVIRQLINRIKEACI